MRALKRQARGYCGHLGRSVESAHGVSAILFPRRLRAEDAHALANVDYRERMALVAEVETGQEPTLIGVARYGPAGEAALADIGLVVEDGWQGLGLGSILLTELLQAGAQRGVRYFKADVLTENYRTLRLLARYTHITQRRTSAGVTSIT